MLTIRLYIAKGLSVFLLLVILPFNVFGANNVICVDNDMQNQLRICAPKEYIKKSLEVQRITQYISKGIKHRMSSKLGLKQIKSADSNLSTAWKNTVTMVASFRGRLAKKYVYDGFTYFYENEGKDKINSPYITVHLGEHRRIEFDESSYMASIWAMYAFSNGYPSDRLPNENERKEIGLMAKEFKEKKEKLFANSTSGFNKMIEARLNMAVFYDELINYYKNAKKIVYIVDTRNENIDNDYTGNLYISRSLLHKLSEEELKIVLIHEALHLLPLQLSQNAVASAFNMDMQQIMTESMKEDLGSDILDQYGIKLPSKSEFDAARLAIFSESNIDLGVMLYLKDMPKKRQSYIDIIKKVEKTDNARINVITAINEYLEKGLDLQHLKPCSSFEAMFLMMALGQNTELDETTKNALSNYLTSVMKYQDSIEQASGRLGIPIEKGKINISAWLTDILNTMKKE